MWRPYFIQDGPEVALDELKFGRTVASSCTYHPMNMYDPDKVRQLYGDISIIQEPGCSIPGR